MKSISEVAFVDKDFPIVVSKTSCTLEVHIMKVQAVGNICWETGNSENISPCDSCLFQFSSTWQIHKKQG